MPGWFIHMDVARKAIAALPRKTALDWTHGPGPGEIARIATEHPSYFALGAIGPDMLFLLPDFKPPLGPTIWKLADAVREIYTALDEYFFVPWETFMGPETTGLQDLANGLTGGLYAELQQIHGEAMNVLVDSLLVCGSRQYDLFGLLGCGVQSAYDEQTFFWSDMLHYRHTSRLAINLWKIASAAPAPSRARLQAFALGWMTHVATDVTGHCYVNEKAGGPYRLHWQRHHLIENHMDAKVYDAEHGLDGLYQMLAASGLHRWIAFGDDAKSCFDPDMGPRYPMGVAPRDVAARKAVFDVDSELPPEVGDVLVKALRATFGPAAAAKAIGQCAASPTIISYIQGAEHDHAELVDAGFPTSEQLQHVYWWMYRYLKMATTDYFNFIKPPPPKVIDLPPFPQPPGTGDSDDGPDGQDDLGKDAIEILLAVLAWLLYLGEIVVWPIAVGASVVVGPATYPAREFVYEAVIIPLYNAWLALHWYMSLTGFVYPLQAEINTGLQGLGRGANWDWKDVVAALDDAQGGLSGTGHAPGDERSGADRNDVYPLGVVVDDPAVVWPLLSVLAPAGPGAMPRGSVPSEFLRPWRWPDRNVAGDPVHHEQPLTRASPYVSGSDATVLVGDVPGDPQARAGYEAADSAAKTEAQHAAILRRHLGSPVDFSAYLIARLTRDTADAGQVADFNLDGDRGYGSLCWDWLRKPHGAAVPRPFEGEPADPPLLREYQSPVKPGHGWDATDESRVPPPLPQPGPTDHGTPFDDAVNDSTQIRYIDHESKYEHTP